MEKLETPFVANVQISKKDYMSLSLFNMRRFIGVRELVLYLVVLGAGLGLFFGFKIWLFLLLFAIVNILIIISVGVFIGTSLVGFKYEFIKTGVTAQKLTFNGNNLVVENINKDGKVIFEETHEAEQIDKIAILKDKIYIFRSTAIYYYCKREEVEEQKFLELSLFLRSHYPPQTFQLHKKIKQYPGYNNKEK